METNQNGLRRKGRFDNDRIMKYALTAVACAAVLIIAFIILFIFGNSTKAISEIGIIDFLTGTVWQPLSGDYGALPVITGTLLVTLGAIAFALPVGLCAAVYISEVANPKARKILKPICEIFAGIPSVVYGFFGLVVLVPFLRDMFPDNLLFGSSWLAGSLLLGIMALPTIISVSEDAIRAVPRSYREASVAMGATKWETTRKIVLPAAISGISAAAILGIGRAIGETMAVMMVTGNAAIFPEPLWNFFSLIRTITASLALEMPEVVVGSVHYSSLFLLALFLMVMILMVNFAAKYIVKRTQRKFGRVDVKESRFSLNRVTGGRLQKSGAKKIKRSMLLTFVFLMVTMVASLFTNVMLSCAIAFVAVVAILITEKYSSRLKSITKQKIAHGSLTGIMVFVIGLLVIIIGDIAIKGAPALSLDFITQYPSGGGTSGGILPAIVGTLKLIAGAMIVALPLGVISGIFLSEYARDTRLTRLIRNALDVLNGTPSVVFGLFGMAALVNFLFADITGGYSLLAGCITLAIMIMPVIIRTTEEAMMAVPREVREASLALGASKWQTTRKVVLPAAFGGVLTGTILSLGRAAGETAPIMFTAVVVFQSSMPSSILDPVMALPYHLYYLASEVPGSETMQYGTALVLLILVLTMFAITSLVRHRASKNIRW